MIKVSVFYPYDENAAFDMDYYVGSHLPLVQARLGGALKGSMVDGGVAGGAPGSRPPYIAVGHLLFDSVEQFNEAWAPHNDEIMGDIPNYTKITPVMQISDVKLNA